MTFDFYNFTHCNTTKIKAFIPNNAPVFPINLTPNKKPALVFPKGSLSTIPPNSTFKGICLVIPSIVKSPYILYSFALTTSILVLLKCMFGNCSALKKSADFKCPSLPSSCVSMLFTSIESSTSASEKSSFSVLIFRTFAFYILLEFFPMALAFMTSVVVLSVISFTILFKWC